MKKLLLALALLWTSPALAQNVQCATRPVGDSSNACASTAFVNNAVGGVLGTAAFQNMGTSGHNVPFLDGNNTWSGQEIFSKAINYTTLPENGLVAQQTLTGTNVAAVNPNFFGINSDDVDTTAVTGFNFSHAYGGSNMSGSRFTFAITSFYVGPDNGVTPNPFYVAFAPTIVANANAGGSPGVPRGNFVAENVVAVARSTATHIANLNASEFDLWCEAPCASIQNKNIVTISELSGNAGHGSISDTMLQFNSTDNANVGFTNIICVCAGSAGFLPYYSGSTIFKVETNSGRTADIGIDMSGITFGTFFIKGPGFTVNNAGTIMSGGIGGTFSPIANAFLANSSITINGSSVSLGGSITVTAAAASVAVGTTTVTSGTTGRVLYDNAGVLGEMTTTGTGTVLALATSAVLVTPTLGVATATSINKVTITAPASGATLTIPDGVTLTGPASSGTAMTLGNTETVTGVKTFGSAGAVGRFKLAGTTSGTTVLDATAIASGTLTLPAATDTLVGKATNDVLTNKTLTTPVINGTITGTTVFPLANGGTNAGLTASNGGLVYSDASALAILAGTATAGQIPRSGANAAPSWSTATYPATAGSSGNVLRSNGTNFLSATLAAADLSNGTTGSGSVMLAASPTSTGTAVFEKLFIDTNAADISIIQILSGAAGNFAGIGLGRTGSDMQFRVSGGTSQFFSGTVAGDSIVWGNTNLWLAVNSGTATAQFTSTGTVFFPVAASSGTISGAWCHDSANQMITQAAATCVISSARFKENVIEFTHGLDWVMASSPKEFNYKPEYFAGIRSFNIMAEDAAKISPLLVTLDGEGKPYGVRDELLPVVAFNAIKELKADNDNLRQEVETLRQAIRR